MPDKWISQTKVQSIARGLILTNTDNHQRDEDFKGSGEQGEPVCICFEDISVGEGDDWCLRIVSTLLEQARGLDRRCASIFFCLVLANSAVTVSELAQGLNMDGNSVRFGLSALRKRGLAERFDHGRVHQSSHKVAAWRVSCAHGRTASTPAAADRCEQC